MARLRLGTRRVLSFKKKKSAPSFPTGKDGPLLINGTTTNLAAGTTKDYSSVTIINGGKLNYTGTSGLWSILGCSGTFTIDATSSIVCQTNGDGTSGTITGVTPSGHLLSYSYSTNNGGLGGESIYGGDPPPDPAFGNATGGQASGTPGDPDINVTGSGGDGLCPPSETITGAAGVSTLGANGIDGSQGSPQGSQIGEAVGAGGSGGFRGIHGGGLSITVVGTVSLATGAKISVVGQKGGNGGFGAIANASGGSLENDGAGGGGAGSGGSGGKIDFLWKGLGTNPTAFCLTGGGLGGTGGASDQSTGFGGTSGGDGDSGNAGSFVLATF